MTPRSDIRRKPCLVVLYQSITCRPLFAINVPSFPKSVPNAAIVEIPPDVTETPATPVKLIIAGAGLGVVVITAVAKRVDVPDEAGGSVLHAFVIVHGVIAPRAVGTAAQRDAAGNDNDDDLWLCADGCTHHSDHLSISLRAVHQHRPQLITTTICPFIILDQSPE